MGAPAWQSDEITVERSLIAECRPHNEKRGRRFRRYASVPTTPKVVKPVRLVASWAAPAAAQVAQPPGIVRGDEPLAVLLASERQRGDGMTEHGDLTGF